MCRVRWSHSLKALTSSSYGSRVMLDCDHIVFYVFLTFQINYHVYHNLTTIYNDNRNCFPKWMCFWFGNCLAAAVICPDQGHVVPPLRRAEDLSEESYKTHLKRLGSFLGASWSPKRLQEAIARWDLKLGAWLGAVGEFGIDALCARFKPNLHELPHYPPVLP